jgi:hypothetical protein
MTGIPPMKDGKYVMIVGRTSGAREVLRHVVQIGKPFVYEGFRFYDPPMQVELLSIRPERPHREGKYGPKWGFKR